MYTLLLRYAKKHALFMQSHFIHKVWGALMFFDVQTEGQIAKLQPPIEASAQYITTTNIFI